MPPTPVVLGPRAEFIEKNLGGGFGAFQAGICGQKHYREELRAAQ